MHHITTTAILLASVLALASGADIASRDDFTQYVVGSSTTLGGINCLVEAVFSVENLANDFIYDIQVCKGESSDEVTKILKYCNNITKKTAKVIDADDKICKNSAYNEDDADETSSSSCTSSIKSRMNNLYTVVYNTNTYLNSDSLTIDDSCSQIAANTLKLNLPIFTESVQNCANLFD